MTSKCYGNPLECGGKQRSPAEVRCTCPSGDGSLRWPCPAHPPETKPAPVGVKGMVEAFEEFHMADHRDPAVAPEWEWWRAAWRAALAQQPPVAPVGVEGLVADPTTALREVLALSNKERDAEENREYGAANDLYADLQGAAVNLVRDHGPALLSALEDARRYRFLAADHSLAWEEELDAAIDAAIAEGEE